MRNPKLARLEARIAKLERESGLFDIFSNKKKNLTRVAEQVADALLESNLALEAGSPEKIGTGIKIEILAAKGTPSYILVWHDQTGNKELDITILDSSRTRYQFAYWKGFEFGNPEQEKKLRELIYYNTHDIGERRKFLRAVSGRR